MIINLYVTISLVCLFLNAFDIMLTKMGIGPKQDPFEIMKEMQELLDDMEEGKFKNFIVNITDACVDNPANVMIIMMLLSFAPLINLFVILSTIKSIIEKMMYKK